MKLSTPTKGGLDTNRRKKDPLSPLKQSNILVSRKRDQSEFQPGLYITAKFTEEDIVAIK